MKLLKQHTPSTKGNDMNAADQKLQDSLAQLSTAALVEIAELFATSTTPEGSVMSSRANRQLAKRMSEEEFDAHMDRLETLIFA